MNMLGNPDCSCTQLALVRDENEESCNSEEYIHAQAISKGTLKSADEN